MSLANLPMWAQDGLDRIPTMKEIEAASAVLETRRRILVFSGAGISTESGIPDFRGPDGLWTKVDPDDFHIDRYLSRSDLRIEGWKMHVEGKRWGARANRVPNRGHLALVDLWRHQRLGGVVTQNVDGLHQAAGLPDDLVSELHGNVRSSHCLGCEKTWPTGEILQRVEKGDEDPHCEVCGSVIKTQVVMFGEELRHDTMDKAMRFLAAADALLVLGSTVAVFPASDVVLRAATKPMPIVIINRGETEADHLAAAKIDGSIGDHLPELVAAIT